MIKCTYIMGKIKKQGIIAYSEPESLEYIAELGQTLDGSNIFKGEVEATIDKNFINVDAFTISYHGLVRKFDKSAVFFNPRDLVHLAISTEELDTETSQKIIQGEYITNRQSPDSLKDLLASSKDEHTLGYGVMASFVKKEYPLDKQASDNYDLRVYRALGSNAVRASLVDFLRNEISRENGQFISSGSFQEEELAEILSMPDVVSTIALEKDKINSAIIFADSPNIFPWFNEERISELAIRSGQTFEDVHLAFLAFTSPEKREKNVASAIFDLAVSEVVKGSEKMTLCVECSPRSIVYVPFMIAKHLSNSWDLKNIIIERSKAVVYSSVIS